VTVLVLSSAPPSSPGSASRMAFSAATTSQTSGPSGQTRPGARWGPAGRQSQVQAQPATFATDSWRLAQVSLSSAVSPCGSRNRARQTAISVRSHRNR
jgi:hypothetical protein